MEAEVARVDYPPLRDVLPLLPFLLLLLIVDRDVENEHAGPRAVVGVDQSHLEGAALGVGYPVRPADLEGDDAVLLFHAWGVVEDEGGRDGGAVDGSGAEAAGQAWKGG